MAPTHNVNSPSGEISERAFEIIQSIRAEQGLEQAMCDKSVKPCRTLQSVLRGEVPSAYMHLAVPANECYFQNSMGSVSVRKGHRTSIGYTPYSCVSPNRHMHNTSLAGRSVDDFRDSSPHRVHVFPEQTLPSPDSVYGQGSTSCQDSDLYAERDSPVMESRFCTFQESVSPFLGHSASSPYHHIASSPAHSGYGSGRDSSSPYHAYLRHSVSPYSPYQRTPSPHSSNSSPFNGSQTTDIELTPVKYSFDGRHDDADTDNDQPMDLSKKSPKPNQRSAQAHNYVIESEIDPTEKRELNNGSLLRNLLTHSHEQRHGAQDPSSGRSTPDSDVYKPDVPISGCTPVTLAKKMVYPITSRVSDWLLKIVQFAKTIPEFDSMSQNDKWTLLVHAWARMLLLLMAENELEFAVTPLTSGGGPGGRDSSVQQPSKCKDEPTMKSVEGVQSFLRKCKNMSLDQKEFALLRMAVLFNTGSTSLDDPGFVEKLNSAVQELLQQHARTTRPDDVMHYSRLLMLFPALYGISCRMVENLFCTHINLDMQVLLKEMLQNL